MHHAFRLYEFFSKGSDQRASHVLLHLTEPSTPAEEQKGYFFAVCEMNQGEKEDMLKLQGVIDDIESGYYETEDTQDKNALEIVLEKMNQQRPFAATEQIHCAVGVVRATEILFSFHGNPLALLFYPTRNGTVALMDLAQNDSAENQDDDKKFFPQILHGKISQHDYVVMGTPHLKNYFGPEQLRKLITSRPPRQATEHIERVLTDLRSELSFGGIIIHAIEQPATPPAPIDLPRPRSAPSPVNTLFVTEQNTAHTLSPSFLKNINQKLTDHFPTNKASAPIRPRLANKTASQNANGLFITAVRGLWLVILYAVKIVWWVLFMGSTLLNKLLQIGKLILIALTNYRNGRSAVFQQCTRTWRGYVDFYRRLPRITKIFFFSAITLAIVFSISITSIRLQQEHVALERAFVASIAHIKALNDEAESALIYKDEVSALNKIAAAKAELQKLSCANQNHARACADSAAMLEQIVARIRKLVMVTPHLVAEWKTISTVPTTSFRIFKIKNKLIGYSASTSTVLLYDLLTHEATTLSTTANGFVAGNTPKENDYALLGTASGRVLRFTPEHNALDPIEVDFSNSTPLLSSLFVYNRRLYSADMHTAQVYKHEAISNGFGRGKEWLASPMASTPTVVDMAIDGDLFVLFTDGTVKKFTSGKPTSFSLQAVDPALTSGTQLWTYLNLSYLYLLDADNKRLIIFDKNGQLVRQISATEFTHPSGMIIDESAHSALIYDTGRLYTIDLGN